MNDLHSLMNSVRMRWTLIHEFAYDFDANHLPSMYYVTLMRNKTYEISNNAIFSIHGLNNSLLAYVDHVHAERL